MNTPLEIRIGLSAVLGFAVAACGSGGPPSDPGANGRLAVQLSTAALEAGQTLSYAVTLSAEDAADPNHFVVTLDTIVMPTESDGSFTGVLPCHGSDAGLAGKADVVATVKDANGGVVGTGDATTLFDCKAGADTPVSLDVSIPVQGDAGFVDISVHVDATEVSAMTGIRVLGGYPTVVTGCAKGVVKTVANGTAVITATNSARLALTNAPATPVDVDMGLSKGVVTAQSADARYFDTRWTVDAMAPAFTLAQFDADLGPPRGTTCQFSCTAGFRSKPVTVVHEAGIAIDEPGVHFTDVGNAVAGLAVRDEHGVIVEGVVVDGRGLTPDDMPAAYGLGVVSASTGSTVLVGPDEFHGIIGPEHPAVAADSQVSIASSTLYLARNADGSPLDIVGLGAIDLDGGKLAVLVGVFGPNGPPIPPPASVTVPGLPWYPMMKGDFSRGHQPDRLYVALCAVVDGKLGCEEDVPGSGYLHLYSPRDAASGLATGR